MSLLTRRALIAAALASAPLALSPPALAAGYRLSRLTPPAPLIGLVTWAPRQGGGDLLIALHGHQAADADPTWFSWLHAQPDFARRSLLVPAVADPARWTDPEVIALIRAQAEALAPARTFLVGFSSGARYGFEVAAALAPQLSGFAALAGSPPHTLDAAALRGVPVLLGCMERDTGAPCASQDAGAAALSAAGVVVERHTFAGLGHECPLEVVAPALADWIDRG